MSSMTVADPRADAKGRIPVTLVTGFLGSGKTTLINSALRSAELAKTVVVVNEFGEVGLDHQLFANSSDFGGRSRERLPLLHRSKRLGWDPQRPVPCATARGHPSVRQRRDRNVGLGGAGPGPSSVSVGANAGRALQRCERSDARRCRQLGGNVGGARRVCSSGGPG